MNARQLTNAPMRSRLRGHLAVSLGLILQMSLAGCHQVPRPSVPPPQLPVVARPAPPAPVRTKHVILYQVTEIGTFGGNTSYAFGLNDQGDVTGSAAAPSGISHIYLYKHHRLRDLGQANAGHSSIGQCINDREQIAGTTSDDRAFLWQRGHFQFINPLPGPHAYFDVGISGLSRDGTVAGTVDDSTLWIGYLWRRGRTRLFTRPPGIETQCVAISPHGCWISQAKKSLLHIRGRLVALQPKLPPKFSAVSLDAVNDAGEAAGNMSDEYDEVQVPVWITRSDKLRVLQSCAAFPRGNVIAINASGSMVGQCTRTNGASHAFRCSSAIMLDLNDAIDPRSGWVCRALWQLTREGRSLAMAPIGAGIAGFF